MSLDQDLTARWTPSPEQDRLAHLALSEAGTVVTAHLLVNKQFGWWTEQVEVVALPGIFLDRNQASAVICAAAEAHHRETGQPCTGGWTYHHLPAPDEPTPISGDGTRWLTSWSVFEDCLAIFPKEK